MTETSQAPAGEYGVHPEWSPELPKIRASELILGWLVSAIALLVAAAIIPGIHIAHFYDALVVAAILAVLNAILSPLLAAIRVPYVAALGFLLVLVLDALMLLLAARILPNDITVDNFGWALLFALVAAAASTVFSVIFGTNDDDAYAVRVTQRIARREGGRGHTDVPGLIFLEIDGLALPVLRRAVRDGNVPNMARWLESGSHVLTGWETDLSSQTGASQAGILLGSNADIPAFRWVEKETGRVMTCSAPADCAEIEQRHLSDRALLVADGASRGNLLSGRADHCILTCSRIEEEKKANPGYRAFFANSNTVTRTFVLFLWEVALELTASARQRRRDVRPRGHRGLKYAFLRGAVCVLLRDLIVYGVLQDMMQGRPIVYATFSSYDEVAHHSGLERADTLEALRKLDQAFGRIDRARRFASRPYHIVVLSDHGQTQGTTFLQRNGYKLDDLVRRNLADARVAGLLGGDENDTQTGLALHEATGGRSEGKPEQQAEPSHDVVVLGSGNLGLIYLMDEPHRLTREEIDERHPDLLPALRAHPHIGVVLVHSSADGPLALGANGTRHLTSGRVEGEDPLASFSANAARHLVRTDGFANAADVTINSFYDPQLEEGCAFEELISFHGGLGGPQTSPFLLHPASLAAPAEPIVGAEHVNEVLRGWRTELQGPVAAAAAA
jgi:uncharacterized membrane protein YvlD (DUF360 family)